MKANGLNLRISDLMTLGKLTAPFGTGLQKLIWEEVEGYYQDWETSQDWQYSASWLATVLQRNDSRDDLLSRVSGLLCRASGQDNDNSQPFGEGVTGHF